MMELPSLTSIVSRSDDRVKATLERGYQSSVSEYFLERHVVSTVYLVCGVAETLFQSLSFVVKDVTSPSEKEWTHDLGEALSSLCLAVSSVFLSVSSLVAPHWSFTWLIDSDYKSPLEQQQEKIDHLHKEGIRLVHERDALCQKLDIQKELLDLFLQTEDDQTTEIAKLNIELMDEIAGLRSQLMEARAEDAEQIDQHFSSLEGTVRLSIKLLGDPSHEMVLLRQDGVQGNNGQILLKTPRDWKQFVENIRDQAKAYERYIDEPGIPLPPPEQAVVLTAEEVAELEAGGTTVFTGQVVDGTEQVSDKRLSISISRVNLEALLESKEGDA